MATVAVIKSLFIYVHPIVKKAANKFTRELYKVLLWKRSWGYLWNGNTGIPEPQKNSLDFQRDILLQTTDWLKTAWKFQPGCDVHFHELDDGAPKTRWPSSCRTKNGTNSYGFTGVSDVFFPSQLGFFAEKTRQLPKVVMHIPTMERNPETRQILSDWDGWDGWKKVDDRYWVIDYKTMYIITRAPINSECFFFLMIVFSAFMVTLCWPFVYIVIIPAYSGSKLPSFVWCTFKLPPGLRYLEVLCCFKSRELKGTSSSAMQPGFQEIAGHTLFFFPPWIPVEGPTFFWGWGYLFMVESGRCWGGGGRNSITLR